MNAFRAFRQSVYRQRLIASELDRTPAEIIKKLEDVFSRDCFRRGRSCFFFTIPPGYAQSADLRVVHWSYDNNSIGVLVAVW